MRITHQSCHRKEVFARRRKRYIEKELQKKDSKKEQKELIEDMLNKDKVEEEKRAGGETREKDWISSEAEFLLPSGWSYRGHFVRRASSRTGLKRSLHCQTDLAPDHDDPDKQEGMGQGQEQQKDGQPGAGPGAAPGPAPAAATAPTPVATTHWPIPGRWRPTTTAQ